MLMRSGKFNRRFSFLDNLLTATALSLSVGVTISGLASYAGPQSLLDPYASIQPPTAAKVQPKALFSKKLAKKQNVNQEQAVSNNVQSDTVANEAVNKPSKVKVKAPKIAKDIPIDQGQAVPNNKISADKPGFLDGVKEIQHGSLICIKCTGSGIVSGSKIAGAKVSAGTRSMCDGVSSLSHKVIPTKAIAKAAPAAEHKQSQVAQNKKSLYPALPGKPLDQIAEDRKLEGKDKPLGDGQVKESRVAHTFNKLNFLSKHKKAQPAQMTASNPNAGLSQ